MMRIPKRQAELDALTRKYLSDPEPNGSNHHSTLHTGGLSDEEVIDLCRKAQNSLKFSDLYDAGDTAPYGGDDSSADLALISILAFYTQDPEQLDRIFSRSALYRPEKWGKRSDYRRRTIAKAFDRLTEAYTPPRRAPVGDNDVMYGTNSERAASGARNTTDLGNAERLIDRHGDDLRYVHAWGRYLVYTGQRWEPDQCGTAKSKAAETVRNIYHEAGDALDEGARKALASHAKKSEAQSRIEAMLSLAEHMVAVKPDDLDRDRWLMNVKNGTVDLRTGELRPHQREHLVTKLAPVEYDPNATAPNFEAFLEQVLPSADLRRFVQRAVGYCLTGDVSEQVLLFMYGAGANGKSTLINAVLAMLGDYGMQAAPELLTAKPGTHPTELADLQGARLAASVEVEDGRRLAESLVKQLTGGDRIKARFMRRDFFEFEPTHKVVLAANHKPTIRGTDHAIWRRITLIPFEVTIQKAEQDPRLFEKLRAELPGILAWAVRGCVEWQRDGLGEPEEVRQATAEYRAEMDVLAAFIDERCVLRENATTTARALYDAYTSWCDEYREKPEKQQSFGPRLTERGFESYKITAGPDKDRKAWRGIGLRADVGGPDDDGTGGN